MGRLARGGDFFALIGAIGAGKTVLAEGLLEGLGVGDFRGSPTFTLIHEYKGRLPVYHFDMYRLGPEAVREDLGYDEYFHGDGVSVVEWAEFCRDRWPQERLEIHIERASDDQRHRVIRFVPSGSRYTAMLEEMGVKAC